MGSFLGCVKCQQHETEHFPLSSAEIQNAWSSTIMPSLCGGAYALGTTLSLLMNIIQETILVMSVLCLFNNSVPS
jgi:hypothetical protein